MVFSDWLLSISTNFSRLIHVVSHNSTSFFFTAKTSSIVWIGHILFVHSSLDGHLNYFCILVIINNSAMSIHVKGFCGYLFLFHLAMYLGMELFSQV